MLVIGMIGSNLAGKRKKNIDIHDCNKELLSSEKEGLEEGTAQSLEYFGEDLPGRGIMSSTKLQSGACEGPSESWGINVFAGAATI
jgi:hypothetical protein